MDVLDIAKLWLESCSNDHEECAQEAQHSYPTRLLSIAGNKVHLSSTTDWKKRPRYSTLSHRWAQEPFLTLTGDNYDSFLELIPTEGLPQTFKDAIDISRYLGIQYLWIDSLCIIQGDEKDWRHEAALMSSVYGGSFVNIAAASARRMNEGCFRKPPHFVCGLRARVKVNGSSFVRDFSDPYQYESAVTGSYLATRAWTLQEKLLPVRTIHFGDTGAFWECQTKAANEFLPEGFTSYLGPPNLLGESRHHFKSWWISVVKLYSAADLTFDKDRLPAISGIARRVHEEEGDRYLAGMWRKNLEQTLCWNIVKPRERPLWRAPSWSWASVNGAVNCITSNGGDNRYPDFYAHVVDANTTCLDEDPFGAVSGGWLRIACTGLLSAHLTGDGTVEIELSDSKSVPEFPFERDYLKDGLEECGDTVYLLPIFGGYSGRSTGTKRDNEEKVDDVDDTYNNKISCDIRSHFSNEQAEQGDISDCGMDWMDTLAIYGIVLHQTDDGTKEFHRIGFFQFWESNENEPDLYKPFLSSFQLRGQEDATKVNADVMENLKYPAERYQIVIV